MTDILSRTFARAFASKEAPTGRPPARLTSGGTSERYNVPDPTRAERQANLYANLSWLQIAVGKVAEACASTPFQVMQRTRTELQQVADHPLELLFEQPNSDQDQTEFLEATVAWKLIAGNCYWWLNRAGEGAPPEEIWILPATQVQPIPDGNLSISGYLYDYGGGERMKLETWEVVHFKTFNPLSRYVGLSAVQALAMDAAGDVAAQHFNLAFYDRDNAKPAGFLAFADAIDDTRLRQLEADMARKSGGTKARRMQILRNVGKGGVEWIATQLTQQDMQYLEQRRFTMEEVYARIAPGLASILAINATEANSTAGKDTFWSMAVYPHTFGLGKKITQKLLPAYGDGFVAQFEDVRRVDTLVELQEQQEYGKVHTIEEIRAKYYGDKPIGDGRDLLLPAEVGSGLTDARPPEEKAKQAMEMMQARTDAQPPPSPDAAFVAAGKALDRRRWRTKATNALAAGKVADVTFDPDYLSDDEAMPIRAALKRAQCADDIWKAVEG